MSTNLSSKDNPLITSQDSHRQFRILSLEGGGIMGTFAASVLSTLEEQTNCRCIDHFDLITGTSTGGIIAIGLGLGIPAQNVLDFYKENGSTIFQNAGITRRFVNSIRHIFQPKHSQDTLREVLRSVFHDQKFGQSKSRLVIPTYDAVGTRIYLMKTAHHKRFTHDINSLAVDVALATSAAPTYFSAAEFPLHPGSSYIDGGIWANCPALVGLVEATHFLGIPSSHIDILNIGTTSSPFSVSQNAQAGIKGWALGLINLLMKGQVESTRAMSFLLTNGGFHHIDYIAPPGKYSLDDSTKINELIALGRAEAVKRENLDKVVRPRFLNGIHVNSFVPLHNVD
jgi:uncharacterized protein